MNGGCVDLGTQARVKLVHVAEKAVQQTRSRAEAAWLYGRMRVSQVNEQDSYWEDYTPTFPGLPAWELEGLDCGLDRHL